MSVHRCPVCEGNGIVPKGFYEKISAKWSSIGSISEECRSCRGKGYVTIRETSK
jgi:RecJ-like exonuclease